MLGPHLLEGYLNRQPGDSDGYETVDRDAVSEVEGVLSGSGCEVKFKRALGEDDLCRRLNSFRLLQQTWANKLRLLVHGLPSH